MAELRRGDGSGRELVWPLLLLVGSTVVTATVYLSLLGAPLVVLSSIALGGVLDSRRMGGGQPVPSSRVTRGSVVVWGLAVAVSGMCGLAAPALAIVDRLGADIDDDVMSGAVAGGFLLALPALVLSAPAFGASVRHCRGRRVPSWPFVAGWALIVILFVFGILCAAALVVDEPRPRLATAGLAMLAWSVAAATANVATWRSLTSSRTEPLLS